MKIAIVGGGFTGLSAAYRLSKQKHAVYLFEKEPLLGGLASSFQPKNWSWPLEKHYHHWFTNDKFALGLIKELGLANQLLFPKTITSIYFKNKMYPFNSAMNVLTFSPLSFHDRIRTGFATLYLKLLPPHLAQNLEKYTAVQWLTKWYGQKAYKTLWKPLLKGKFGPFADKVNMAWFWARIYKRTPRLGYLKGGYEQLIAALAHTIKQNGGKIFLSTPFNPNRQTEFDKTIITTPSAIFAQMFPRLPANYKKSLAAIPHLHAYNLVLITKEKILKDIYWLNINDRSFPFLAVVQQTNLIDPKYYGGSHVAWIGNYLPVGHPFLKMSKEKLFKLFIPYLKKINPSFNYELRTTNYELFYGPFAQPVFGVNYSKQKPTFTTPLKNVYLANMDMVYPWDRGTNYAIEMGEEVAKLIEN